MKVRALAALAAAWLAACSDSEGDGTGGGGAGGKGEGATGATSTTASLGITTCDDIAVCVDGAELGCTACAVKEGSCIDEQQACDANPSDTCALYLACFAACLPDDIGTPQNELLDCQTSCGTTFPAGPALLPALTMCIYCTECRLSCPVEAVTCPAI